jgi:hypothetical protein
VSVTMTGYSSLLQLGLTCVVVVVSLEVVMAVATSLAVTVIVEVLLSSQLARLTGGSSHEAWTRSTQARD